MLLHFFRLATLAKGAVAVSLVAGAYTAGNAEIARYHELNSSEPAKVAAPGSRDAAVASASTKIQTKAQEIKRNDEPTTTEEPKSGEAAKNLETESSETLKAGQVGASFDALVRSCAAKYAGAASLKEGP